MASSPTTRNRFERQGAGENSSTWGAPKLNNLFDLLDAALDGWTTKVLSANVTLTSTNFAADESRPRILKFLGTGAFQVNIPSVEKWYIVDNQLTGILTITTGAGTSATLAPTESAVIVCDGTNCKSLGVGAQSMKAYVDTKVTLPSGVIVMWSGSVASIPNGWLLCNGANGTPNLMDRFIVGAGSSYAPGVTGGAATYALDVSQLPAHSHTQQGTFASGTESALHAHGGTTDVVGDHVHGTITPQHTGSAGVTPQVAGIGDPTVLTTPAGSHSHTIATGTQNAFHSHNLTISGQTTNVGSGAAIENRPPYFALAYIMKA
jgi:microcystin-dependent protein